LIPALLIGAALAGLVVWYMRRPNFHRLRVSAARFLPPPPAAQSSRVRWAVSAPIKSWRFYLRLAVLALLLAASVLSLQASLRSQSSLRVAVIVDVSHSMGRCAGDEASFLPQALEALSVLSDQLERTDRDANFCLVVEEVGAGRAATPISSVDGLRAYRPVARREGASIQELIAAARAERGECPPTHVVILTDAPAPAAPSLGLGSRTLWLDLAPAADNVGLVSATARSGPLSTARGLVVEIGQFGAAPDALRLNVVAADGRTTTREIDVALPGPWRATLGDVSGEVRLELQPGGAYDGDDRATVLFAKSAALSVDWRLQYPPRPALPGWREQQVGAPVDLLVTEIDPASPEADALQADARVLVYPGLEPPTPPAQGGRIGLFTKQDGLLEAVNFDILERRMRGLESLPSDYSPILADESGRPVVALRARPRTVVVPGPISGIDDDGARLFSILLFNAVRWALEPRVAAETPLIFRDFAGREISNASLESDTSLEPRSVGTLSDIRAVEDATETTPIWPILVLLSLLLMAVERLSVISWTGRRS